MVRDPFFRNRLIRDAIWSAIYTRMKADPRVICLGEGAEMKVHYDAPAIEKDFPDRVLTLPISENANIDFSVGLALGGFVPVYDVITSDFMYRAFDSIANTCAKLGEVGEPRTIVIRAEFLTGGPTTGQRLEALFTHIPGLNVVVPSNPADAYGLMVSALEHKGVTVFFEDRMIPDATTSELEAQPFFMDMGNVGYALGTAMRRKSGDRLTVASYGLTLRTLDSLLAGQSYELIDLRSLYPLDVPMLVASVRKTGALLFVEPDVKHGGVGAEVVAAIAEAVPGCRVARLGAPRVGIPSCRELHERLLPSDAEVLRVAAGLAWPEGSQWA